MADVGEQVQQPALVTPPLTVSATNTLMTFNATEFLVTLGHARVHVTNENGAFTPNQIIEWLMTISFPPVAAKMLAMVMMGGVEKYEETFGKIPVTPGFEVNIGPINS